VNIACIGSTQLNPKQIQVCETIGRSIVNYGDKVSTGNAKGADQAYARGGNSVDPWFVRLCLPWRSYEREAIVHGNVVEDLQQLESAHYAELEAEAKAHHGAWHKLSQGGQKLQIRNGLILDGCGLVIAWPNVNKSWGGGTGQGMKVAKSRGIEVVDLSKNHSQEFLYELCERIRKAA